VNGTVVDKDLYRHVIGGFLTGVTVVTASDAGHDQGMALSAITSVSLDPPTLLVCVNRTARTSRAIRSSGGFGVNILAADQEDLAQRFASRHADKFDGLAVDRDNPLGVPVLPDVLGWLACRVVDQLEAGTHTIFVAEVMAASGRSTEPLAYFRGGFGRTAA